MSRSRFAIITVALPLLFSGCGAVIDKAADSASERAVEELAEANGGGQVDIERDGESFSIRTEDGSMSVDEEGNVVIESDEGTITASSSQELPDDFPEFPLPDGLTIESVSEITSADADIYSVSGQVAGDPEAIFDAWLSEIEGAGYSIDMRNAATNDGAFFGSSIVTKDEAMSGFLGLETVEGGANLQASITVNKG